MSTCTSMILIDAAYSLVFNVHNTALIVGNIGYGIQGGQKPLFDLK